MVKKTPTKFIGNAGEHYVMGELLKRQILAALTPRDTPGIDILASNNGKTARIRVKTKSEGMKVWHWNTKKDGTIFLDLQEQGDFVVLVNLALNVQDMEFFVIPTNLVEQLLIRIHQEWLITPGKKGQQHFTGNRMRQLNYIKCKVTLAGFKDRWDILWV